MGSRADGQQDGPMGTQEPVSTQEPGKSIGSGGACTGMPQGSKAIFVRTVMPAQAGGLLRGGGDSTHSIRVWYVSGSRVRHA